MTTLNILVIGMILLLFCEYLQTKTNQNLRSEIHSLRMKMYEKEAHYERLILDVRREIHKL